jgi:VCBS repeat protein
MSRLRSVFAAALLASTSARAAIDFGPSATFAIGESTTSLASGDFDEDGVVDLVAPNGARGDVLVLRGNGTGGFFEPMHFACGLFPAAIVVIDANEDGHLDVAVADCDGNAVVILLGDGHGRLGSPSPFAVGSGPTSLAAADVDEDGHVDLVVGESLSLTATVLLGDGRGSFSIATTIPGDPAPQFVVAADLDGDGHVDLAIGQGNVRVRWGDGTGAFPSSTDISPFALVKDVAIGDLDGDGIRDLAIAVFSRHVSSALYALQDGHRGFRLVYCGGNVFGTAVATADFDHDGRTDVAVRAYDGLDVHAGDPAPCGSWRHLYPSVGGLRPLVAADFDGDGRIDLAGAFGGISVVLNRTLDPIACRRGNVNAIGGGIVDVLRVNGSAGEGPERSLVVDRSAPLEIRMDAPPLDPSGPAAFVLYGWSALPDATTVRELPLGVGQSCLPLPLHGVAPQPFVTWNNLGHTRALGAATLPSRAAPSVVWRARRGIGRAGRGFLQGLIVDYASPQGRIAVTNGIALESR